MKLKSVIVNLNSSNTLITGIIKSISDKRHNIEKGKIEIPVFKDGETSPHFRSSLRGKRVYLLSSPNTPLKREQLLLSIDAARRASASEIIPILPYFPYARQDKKDQYRGPIGARVMAEMIEQRGASSIITFDLHSDQIVGFFKIPVIHLSGKYLFYNYILKNSDSNTVLCSPDAGGLKRVKKVRDLIYKRNNDIKIPFVSLDKTRPVANKVGEIEVLGNVEGKNVLVIDDMIDTFGTGGKSVDALLEAGALSVSMIVTHGVLSERAIERINNSKLSKLIISDSIEHTNLSYKIEIISTSNMISEAILSINNDFSIIN